MPLTKADKSQPRATLAAFLHSMVRKWPFMSITVHYSLGISCSLSMEHIVYQCFILAITGHPPCSLCDRQLFGCSAQTGWPGPT